LRRILAVKKPASAELNEPITRFRKNGSMLEENTLPVLAAIIEVENDGLLVCDGERDNHTLLEPNRAKAGTNTVMQRSALGGDIEAAHLGFQAVDIAKRDVGGCPIRNPRIERQQIGRASGDITVRHFTSSLSPAPHDGRARWRTHHRH